MKTSIIALCTGFFLTGCVINVVAGNHNTPDKHLVERFEIDASALTQLVASTEAGTFTLQGEAGRTTVEVVADIYSYEGIEHNIQLQGKGNKAVLHASMPRSLANGQSPYINLTVKVPSSFGLNLDDGSGDIAIKGLTGDLIVKDGSGEVQIDGGRSVMLEDGSGDAMIRNIQGAVTVEDGSGDLLIEQIGGVVTIDDGSGDIKVYRTAGLVITDAGSGDLDVDQINGPVSIAKD